MLCFLKYIFYSVGVSYLCEMMLDFFDLFIVYETLLAGMLNVVVFCHLLTPSLRCHCVFLALVFSEMSLRFL